MKIITGPLDCAYNRMTGDIHYCNHPSMTIRYCTWVDEFPDSCPLQDGVPIGEIDGLITRPKYTKKESKHECTHHKHTYYKNGKRIYPKRNRKDCFHYNIHNHAKSTCYSMDIAIKFKENWPSCKGVKCGYFKNNEK
jgi:hypothetical protein